MGKDDKTLDRSGLGTSIRLQCLDRIQVTLVYDNYMGTRGTHVTKGVRSATQKVDLTLKCVCYKE